MHIFLSHAAVDEKIADSICSLLGDGLGITRKFIFCSSLPGQSIPGGFNFVEHIKVKLCNADVVICLLTQNYIEREFCMAELGACWILEKRVIPLVVPPLTISNVSATLSLKQAWRINDEDDLSSFAKDLFGKVDPALWGYSARKFKDSIDILIGSQPKPEKIAYSEYLKNENFFKRASCEVDNLKQEMETLKEKYERLKQCKDFHEVYELEREFSSDDEQFEALVESVKKQLQPLPKIVEEAIYYEYKGESLPFPEAFDDTRKSYLKDAIDQKLLIWDEDKPICVNNNHPAMKNIRETLRILDNFLERVSPEYKEMMESKCRFTFELDNKQFWEKYLF